MTTGVRSHRESALLNTGNLCFGRQRHHHIHGRRRYDNRQSQLHVQLQLDVKSMAYGPKVDDRLTVYGPGVTLDLAYGLTNIESAVKAEA